MVRWWMVLSAAALCAAAKAEPAEQGKAAAGVVQNRTRAVTPRHRHETRAKHSHTRDHVHPHRDGRVHSHSTSTAHGHGHGTHGHKHKHGIETEHLFGFTKGSDIDSVGSKHLIADFSSRFGKLTGNYFAASNHLEYAFTPWRDFHVGLGAAVAVHNISGVEGLENYRQVAFEGLSLDLRSRLLDRTKSPFGLTLVAEPHWARLDETSGQPATKFAVEFNLVADKEIIKDRLYAAMNVIYEPEWVRLKAAKETERESTIGISFATMIAVAPSILVGGEARYLRKYEGLTFDTYAGNAVFLGPVLFINVTEKLTLVAAYSSQIAGRAVDSPGSLDLENFERHRAKLKAVINF